MAAIATLTAEEILDSRGNPTLEVTCTLMSGAMGRASVPSGASTGLHEALELRDGDKKRYNGLGVLTARGHIHSLIEPAVAGKPLKQKSLDDLLIELDETENKSKLGANAILGVSLAFAKACATEQKQELYEYFGKLGGNTEYALPQPMFNIINGGKHADSGLDIQEYKLAPIGFDTFARTVQAGSEIISSLKSILKERNLSTSVGDEGGFAPKLSSNEEALSLIVLAAEKAGYSKDSIGIGIDVAASNLFDNGIYTLKIYGEQKKLRSIELIEWYGELAQSFPLLSIEDGLAEDDWDGFALLTEKLGQSVTIIGDDLTVTNTKRIQTAIEKHAINSVLIKLNQIGTVSETIEAINLTKSAGWIPFVSHRSGETTDTFIADLAVGLSCQYIKSGSLIRGERVCKYNRLIEIERLLSA